MIRKGINEMMKAKDALSMEEAIKENISVGFFEHGTHTEMDLVFYEAYSTIHNLRMILAAYENELREITEDLIRESRGDIHGEPNDDCC